MSQKNLDEGRRQFLAKALPAGAVFCLGCKGLMASPDFLGSRQTPGQKPGYLEDAGMTAEDVYKFAFGYFLPFLEAMGKDLGRGKLLDMLGKAAAENYTQLVASMAKDYPGRDMKSFAKMIDSYMSIPIYKRAFAFEVTELTDRVYEVKYTQCLPAKIFREMNAADIGYALECSPADAFAKAFNPKMKLTNPKNLMKGDSFCLERFVLDV